MLSEEVARKVAGWAGRKLSDHWLRELAKAHDTNDAEAFDRITEQLFDAKCCAGDWRLRELLSGSHSDRLEQFREALRRHVAPAIGEYTDRPCSQRVAMYLQDLEHALPMDEDSIDAMEPEFEEVMA